LVDLFRGHGFYGQQNLRKEYIGPEIVPRIRALLEYKNTTGGSRGRARGPKPPLATWEG